MNRLIIGLLCLSATAQTNLRIAGKASVNTGLVGGGAPVPGQATSCYHLAPADTTLSCTFGSSVTNGNLIWTGTSTDDNGIVAITGVSGCGGTWSKADSDSAAIGGGLSIEIWWAIASGSPGACTVTLTYASNIRGLMSIEEDAGLPSGSTLDQHTTTAGTQALSVGPVTTTKTFEMLVAINNNSGGFAGHGTGYTTGVSVAPGNTFFVSESRGVSATGSYVGDFTSEAGLIVFNHWTQLKP